MTQAENYSAASASGAESARNMTPARPASPYWWCRATSGERRVTRSTKEANKKKAAAFAREFYEALLQRMVNTFLSSPRRLV